jgi:hypothetical protein
MADDDNRTDTTDCDRATGQYSAALHKWVKALDEEDAAQAERDRAYEAYRRATRELGEAKRSGDDPADAEAAFAKAEAAYKKAAARLEKAKAAAKAAEAAYAQARAAVKKACPDGVSNLVIFVGGTEVIIPFGKRYDRRLHAILKILEKLKRKDLSGTDKIMVSPLEPQPEWIGDGAPSSGTVIVGEYEDGDITVYHGGMMKKEPVEVLQAVIKHEVGHGVWREMSGPLKDAWIKFWKENTGDMPTEYAKKKPTEGFSEVFEHYRDNRDLKPSVTEKIKEILDRFEKEQKHP